MICVFGPSLSGVQCLRNICSYYSADHNITNFNLMKQFNRVLVL